MALVGRDAVGLRYLGAVVPRMALWIGATAGSALGNATGFGALTGGAVRARVYGVADVTPAQIGRMTVFTSVSLALALVLMTALGMVCMAGSLAPMLHLTPVTLRWIGAALLVALALRGRRMPPRNASGPHALAVAVVRYSRRAAICSRKSRSRCSTWSRQVSRCGRCCRTRT